MGAFMKFRIVQAGLLAAIALGMYGLLAQDATGAGASFPSLCMRSGPRPQQGDGRAHQLPVDRLERWPEADRCQDCRLGASDMPLKDEELAKGGYIHSRP